MTANPAPATRVVVLQREGRAWRDGYFTALLGLSLKMPALVEDGRVLAGYLVGVEETKTEFRLEFSQLEPES